MSVEFQSVVYPARPPHYHGFCWSCCHPAGLCYCGWPQCRKEAKELVVYPAHRKFQPKDGMKEASDEKVKDFTLGGTTGSDVFKMYAASLGVDVSAALLGTDSAFIGGGCCVHLSVEYMPSNASLAPNSIVVVMVADSEKTLMGWAQATGSGSVYQVRENVITTKPGAHLVVAVANMVARVRWCEVFSC